MSRDFDFSQFERFAENWQRTYNDFEKFLKKFLLEQAQRVIAQTKKNTPVDTGALRAMWGIGSQNIAVRTSTGWSDRKGQYQDTVAVDKANTTVAVIDMVGDNFEIAIWNGMDYASFIEYGSRFRDGSWRDGRFMLTVAIDDVTKKMPIRFQKAWNEFLSSHGV